MEFNHFMEVANCMTLLNTTEIERAVEILTEVRKANGTAYLAGNGGSAATASHFANDLNKIARVKAICLSEMVPTFLAYGNDFGWEHMFATPLRRHISSNDVFIGFSCSGNSENIIECFHSSSRYYSIGFTGPGPSEMTRANPSALIIAMSDDITVQEDIHLIVCHAIAKELADA